MNCLQKYLLNRILASLAVALLVVGICDGQDDVNKKAARTKQLVAQACDRKIGTKKRHDAVEKLAKLDDWQSLCRVLVWVTEKQSIYLLKKHKENPIEFLQNKNHIQELPVPEVFIVKELVRINNPGAIPYLKKYRSDRFTPPINIFSGETLAGIDASIKRLEKSLSEWEPYFVSNKQ